MEFLKERVFTALNADELKVGSKVIVADTIDELKQYVEDDCDTSIVTNIMPEFYAERFNSNNKNYNLAYLVSVPEETWIVYICRREGVEPSKPYLTCCRSDKWESVKEGYGAKTKLFEGTENEAEEWYTARKHLADIIAAWEDGKTIQFHEDSTDNWIDTITEPIWSTDIQYRIKPEGLKWTDLKIGDILREKNGTETRMVTVIDTSNEPDSEGDICHICLSDWWPTDKDLEDWEKVE